MHVISVHSPRPLHPSPMLSTARHSCFAAPPTPPHELDPTRTFGGTVISTFSPHPRTPSPPSHPTTSSNVLMGRSSYQLFVSTRSRVIRIFNLPKDASAYLASLFHPSTPHAPLTMWTLREEYGGPPPGDEDSIWAVFKSHDEAAAALGLSGGTVSVATALEADLEPFQKLRKLELRRHSVPSLTTPLSLSRHYNPPPIARSSNSCAIATGSNSPISPIGPSHSHVTDLSRLGLPLRTSQSSSDLRARGLGLDIGPGIEEYGFTLSSNPPNPRNTFRQGDWICASLNCAAHNFMRNIVCIGCGSARPSTGPSPSASGSNAPISLPWPRVASSPRFSGVPSSDCTSGPPQTPSDFMLSDLMYQQPRSDFSDTTYLASSPLAALPPQRSLPKMPSLPSFPSGHTFSPNAPFSPTGRPSLSSDPSFSSTHASYPPTNPPFSPKSSFSPSSPSFPPNHINAANVAAAAVALKLPSILTPSGRAFSIGGKVQNVSSDPLAPCVLYWPDNEPFPEQGQIRPPGNVGAQPPPILNTGNKGPIEQQPGDWVCRKCDYLNWRRRKVCQTCFPYAEGNTDGVSASVQAERITMLAQVLSVSQSQSHTAQLQAAESHSAQLLAAQSHSQSSQVLMQTRLDSVHSRSPHSIPTPPNDTLEYVPDQRALYSTPHPGSPSSNSLYNRAISSSPESEYFPTAAAHCNWNSRFPLLPSFFHEEDGYVAPGPATPPLSVSSGSSSPQSTHGPTLHNSSSSSSLAFSSTGSSIWALRKEEVDK